jgi:antitoxin PrlF
MSKSSGETDEGITVSVSPNGQATIPKEFREKLGIDAPGRVVFRERDGEVVIERVPGADEMQGFAAERGEATTDEDATDLLREKRREERAKRDQS